MGAVTSIVVFGVIVIAFIIWNIFIRASSTQTTKATKANFNYLNTKDKDKTLPVKDKG